MVWLIALFTFLSYSTAAYSIFNDKYKPSIYTRIIWFGIAFNNFASVFALNNPDGLPFKDLYARRAQLYIAAADLVLDIAPEETAEQSLANLIELRSSK